MSSQSTPHEIHRARPSRWLIPYVVGIDLATLIALLTTLQGLPPRLWLHLLVFVPVAALTESWTVTLRREGEISLSFTIYYAAAVLFGPCFGIVTAVSGSLLADGLVRRKGVAMTAFGAGQLAISAGLAGLAFEALRSGHGFGLVSNAPAYAAAAVVYVLVNSVLATGVFALHGRPFLHVWLHALREGGAFYVAMAPLGALVVNAYQQSPWTMLYFPLLIWVVYKGFRLYDRLSSETDNALVVLANTIDKRDRYTYEHSLRVARYVARIAAKLGLPAEEQKLVVSAAQVHDLGKLSVDNRILLKEGPMTDEEREQIRTHPAAGAELAGQFSMYRAGAAIIRHHHERWDGNGYPDGLAGEGIPFGARIIAVADAYDAMTSDRPYRDALADEVAVAELIRGSGSQFDPWVVEAFLSRAEEARPAASRCAQPARSLT
ncbi:MAG: HD-GYP domain-containing protein [Thermoleophilia bacterium]